MSLYLSYKIETKNNEKIHCASWSNTEIPVLAVTTEKNKISFYQDESVHIPEHDLIKSQKITSIAWHPSEMTIAYGLMDGIFKFT
jgi:hypothetical protein